MTRGILWSLVWGEDATLRLTGVDETDPTGWTFLFVVSNYPGQDPVSFSTDTVTVGGGPDPDPFTLSVTLSREQTAALTEQDYVWELWRTDTGENVVLASGTIRVKPAVRLAG